MKKAGSGTVFGNLQVNLQCGTFSIKKHRGTVKKCSRNINVKIRTANIANYFAGIYEKLYNQVSQGDQITGLLDSLNQKISNKKYETNLLHTSFSLVNSQLL